MLRVWIMYDHHDIYSSERFLRHLLRSLLCHIIFRFCYPCHPLSIPSTLPSCFLSPTALPCLDSSTTLSTNPYQPLLHHILHLFQPYLQPICRSSTPTSPSSNLPHRPKLLHATCPLFSPPPRDTLKLLFSPSGSPFFTRL